MITGFPSPAQGYEDKCIDLNSLMVKHPSATVFMKIDSDRYVHMGIYNGDLIVVDRSLNVTKESYVVYEYLGEFHLGRAGNIKTETLICGVITHVIHTVKNSCQAF